MYKLGIAARFLVAATSLLICSIFLFAATSFLFASAVFFFFLFAETLLFAANFVYLDRVQCLIYS